MYHLKKSFKSIYYKGLFKDNFDHIIILVEWLGVELF